MRPETDLGQKLRIALKGGPTELEQIVMNSVDSRSVTCTLPRFAEHVRAFAGSLREHGLTVSPPMVIDALHAVNSVGVEDPMTVKTALKACFLTRIEDGAVFDRLYHEFVSPGGQTTYTSSDSQTDNDSDSPDTEDDNYGESISMAEASTVPSQEAQAHEEHPVVMYSRAEVLRDRDFKELLPEDDPRMTRLIREILEPLVRRVSVRYKGAFSGHSVDFRRLFRKNVKYGGEIMELPRIRPKPRIRRLVFLCDVSGSMNPYLRLMLLFIKELQKMPVKTEAFVFATRLSRVTHALRTLPFSTALEDIAATVKDWSGGTRIGHCLSELTARHGDALLRPSTVVLIHSDGWDRGDADMLEEQMALLRRRAYRTIWINPLLGGLSYEPTCRGMRTALPHVDSFLPGHNISGLETVAGTLRELLT